MYHKLQHTQQKKKIGQFQGKNQTPHFFLGISDTSTVPGWHLVPFSHLLSSFFFFLQPLQMPQFLTHLMTVKAHVSWHLFFSRSLFLSKTQAAFAARIALVCVPQDKVTSRGQLPSPLTWSWVSAELTAKLPPHQYGLEFYN